MQRHLLAAALVAATLGVTSVITTGPGYAANPPRTGKVLKSTGKRPPGWECRTQTVCVKWGKASPGMIAPPCAKSEVKRICGKFPNPN